MRTIDMSLNEQRKKLDALDDALLDLLGQRLDLAREVAAHKQTSGRRLRDRAREAEILARIADKSTAAGLAPDSLVRIYQEILNLSFYEQVAEVTAATRKGAAVTVGFQGVPGAYSQWAAERLMTHRKQNARTVGFRSFQEVTESVAAGRTDYGILPVENTLAGSINDSYDLLQRHALYVVAEEAIPVDHCLAAIEKIPLHEIKRIYSHPQALAQCTTFLNTLPGAETIAYYDTAAAMQKVAADADPAAAAIAGSHAARRYGLVILKDDIANNPENFTRFLLVAREREEVPAGVATKTSLVMTVRHKEGALLEALRVIHDHKINLTKLESRPRPGSPWQYYFYVDFEGHDSDANVAAMLNELKAATADLRVLGSYVSRAVSEGRPVTHGEIQEKRNTPNKD